MSSTMTLMLRLFHLALLLLCVPARSAQTWPLQGDGINDVVQWDHYSFELHGRRAFLFAGEFHYWRIPVPEMWLDILQKIKAAGFTTFSYYNNWAYHAPNNQTVDFSTGAHDFAPMLGMAKEVGLYAFARPGPYINAEANAGGFPLWLTTGAYGPLRDNGTRYTEAWKPYFSQVSEITSRYSVANAQNVLSFQIENEYGMQWSNYETTERIPNETAIAYMELLEADARANGITVPLVANEPNMYTISWDPDWSDDGGNVDVTGLDSYPSCWTCDLSQCDGTNGVYVPYKVVEYYGYFQEAQPEMPSFLTEFQGGSFNPWGGPQGGCPQNIGPDFVNLFYRWNIGQRVTAVSLYMVYGGTNWGAIAAPVVATSYDYSAPISEDRSIGAKYYETKLITMFARAAQDLTKTNLIGNGTSYSTNAAIQAWEIRNPDTNAGFYVTLHADSTQATNEYFKLHIDTSDGPLTVPRFADAIQLDGHQSKIIVSDFRFGDQKLLYSTAEVMTYAIIDGTPTLALWVPTGETGEFAVTGVLYGWVEKCQGCSDIQFHPQTGAAGLSVTFTQAEGMSVIVLDNGVRVLLLDRTYAYQLWAPPLSSDPTVPAHDSILVQGPYLVRTAAVSGWTVVLTGDAANETTVEVFAPLRANEVVWNGRRLETRRTPYGSLEAWIPAPQTIALPSLNEWKVNESLPEKSPDYDDSGPAWVDANRMTTDNPTQPVTLPVLYSDEYGFHNGAKLWRGYFSGKATGIFLKAQGGNAFGWSLWLNGHFVGSFLGSASLEQGNRTLQFDPYTLAEHGENVILVVLDDTGHDETTGVLNPRGILQASLLSADNATEFSRWRVAGNAGGESNIDPVRGPLNEDGFYGERVGWQLPGFDDSQWQATAGSELSFSGAGVKFYRTVVPLDIPRGLDVAVSFVLSACGSSKALRASLLVNGYQYGRFFPWIGHQVEFPVPPGILDYTGDNTIGLVLWSQTDAGACVTVDWKTNYVLDSSLDVTFNGDYLRPGWTPSRLKYA